MSETMKIERRQYPRIAHSYTISFKKIDNQDTGWDISNTKNLSFGGAFFLSSEFFPTETPMDIKLRIPAYKGYCVCKGLVKRCQASPNRAFYRTAVQFVETDNSSSKALRESINFFLGKNY